MKDTIMLTIDSSTKKTGIAIWKNAKHEDSLLIDFSKIASMEERFPLICKEIISTLDKYQPTIIYIEEEVVARNMSTCRFLFRLQGVIEGWCIFHDCEFNTVRPSTWRKACGFSQGKKKRAELKQLAIMYVRENYSLDTTEDVAEAICIGDYALRLFDVH